MWKGLFAAFLATALLAGCNTGDRNAMNDDNTPAKEIRRGVDDVIDNNYTPRYNDEINSAPNSTVPPALRDGRNGVEVDRVAPNDGVTNDGQVIERRGNQEDIVEDPADMRDRNNVDNR